MKRIIVIMLVIGCLMTTSILNVYGAPQEEKTASGTVYMYADFYVDDDAPDYWYEKSNHVKTIGLAIEKAEDGDTIFVFDGTYRESIEITETVSLYGQNWRKTVVAGHVSMIKVNNVKIDGFTVKEGFLTYEAHQCTISGNCFEDKNDYCALEMYVSSNNIIKDNIIKGNSLSKAISGIKMLESNNNIIFRNEIKDVCYGIYLLSENNNNKIVANNFKQNLELSIYLYHECDSNIIYYNNFIEKKGWFYAYDTFGSSSNWYSETLGKGNYWDDYTGDDLNRPYGIGDVPYFIHPSDEKMDRYPLMEPVDIYSVEI